MITRFLFIIRHLILIIFLTCFSGIYSYAQSSKQLKSEKQKLEQDIASTQKLLNQTERNKKASLQQIAVLRQQINNREQLIATLNNEIFQLEEEQDLNIKKIQELKKKLEYMKSDYAQVVYMSYRNRRLMDKVTFILAADNFSQMFRRLRFYTVFAHNVRQQALLIHKTEAELEEKNEEIILLKNEKLNLLDGKEREVKQLEFDRRKKSKDATKLKNKSRQLANELKTKQRKRKDIDIAIKRAIENEIASANAKRILASTRGTKSGKRPSESTSGSTSSKLMMTPEEKNLSSTFINNKGNLPWPVARGTKIGKFGNYSHPDVPSVQIENRGIDILVEPNTNVRAVFQGEVTGIMDIMGAKVLMVRHGDYLTVYQNLNTILVNKGDKVTTKQILGTIAKNTTSNTYELHFELWKNNMYLNPSDWLAHK